jgi:hypothetical protein
MIGQEFLRFGPVQTHHPGNLTARQLIRAVSLGCRLLQQSACDAFRIGAEDNRNGDLLG